ncbi:MAG: methylmalonyl-CoA mutase family protein [Spirosomataceae bacterium]
MSAVIGGCDVLSVHGYDTAFRPSDDFSERIAKNISIILKEEALFDKVADPAAGSYYIENLTLQLIDAAWTLFLEIETKGGLMSAFEQNFIQELIEKSYDYQLSALKNHKSRMVGVNSLQEAPTVSTIQSSQPINDSTLKLLINKRISRDFEH